MILPPPYTPTERETWHVQTREAEKLTADPQAAAPFLAAHAAGRGITAAELAGVVVQKNAAFADATGRLMAKADLLLAMDPIPADFADDRHWPAP